MEDSDRLQPSTPDEEISAASVAWRNIQMSTFSRWANEQLKPANMEVHDLETDLCDGVRLIRLVESLAGVKVAARYNAKPTTRTQKLENVTLCLQFLERQQRVRIINIDSADIVDGNLKLILGLMWTLIQYYSISQSGSGTADGDQRTQSSSRTSPRQQLLAWINGHVTDRRVTNFTSDWKDGKTLGALVNSVAPDECSDWRTWPEEEGVSNTKRAIEAASVSLNIAPLITADEMCDSHVDEFSIMTYVAQFPNASKLTPEPEPELITAVSQSQQQSARPADAHADDTSNESGKAALIQAYGDGLSRGNVGHPAEFTVVTVDRSVPLSVDVKIVGPSSVRLVPRETAEGHKFTYIVSEEGAYVVSILYNERTHIPGSPFRPTFNTITNTYKVTVYTGSKLGAGTDANVYIVFVGEIGETAHVQLKTSRTHVNKFEKGNRDEFITEVYNIGELKHIRMGHDNAGGFGAWFLDRVQIELPLFNRKWNFPHSRWISQDDDDGKLEHVLYPDSGVSARP